MKKDLTNILSIAILAAFFLVMATALVACQSDTPAPTQTQPEATTPPEPTQPQATTPPEQTEPEATIPPEPTQPEATTPPAETSTIDGAALLDERCTVCHSAARVTGETNTSEGWDAIVTEMIGKGAVLTEDEKAVLVDYLAQNYGK